MEEIKIVDRLETENGIEYVISGIADGITSYVKLSEVQMIRLYDIIKEELFKPDRDVMK